MPENRIIVEIYLTHEEMAVMRQDVRDHYIPEQRHLVKDLDPEEVLSLWISIQMRGRA